MLASQICGTPIALVSLIDEKRQWFKSHHGLEATETPRDVSFCGHAILEKNGVFEITNSLSDSRFADNPLVTGDPRVIFYAGAPLKAASGEQIGTLCVIDHKPQKLTEQQVESLKALAEQVMALFEMRLKTQQLIEANDKQRKLEEIARLNQNYLQTTLRSIGDAVIATTADQIPKILFLNTVAEELTGWTMVEAVGRPVSEVFQIINVKTRLAAVDPIGRVLQEGRVVGLANHTALIARDGREIIIEDSAAPIREDEGAITGVVLVFRDVSEKVILEEKSELLNAVIENSKDFIGIAKADGTAFYVNPAGRKLLGLGSNEDVLKTRIIDYFAPEEVTRVQNELIPEIVKTGFWDGRVLFKNFKTEDKIPVSWNVFSIPDVETHEVAAIACVSKDLRDSDAREFAITEERTKLTNLLSQMPVGVCLLEGPSHRYTFLNNEYEKLIGTHRSILGKTVKEALPELESTEILKILDQVFLTGESYAGTEFLLELKDKDNKIIHVYLNFNYEAMYNAVGEIYGIAVTCINVTEQIQGRKALESKEVQLGLALTTAQIGTWNLDIETHIVTWSDRGAEIFGYKNSCDQELQDAFSRIHEEDRERVQKLMADAISSQAGRYEDTHRLILPNGDTKWISASGQVIFAVEGQDRQPVMISGTVIDVTSAMNLQNEMIKAKELADTANSAKSSFLANMSHEIRSPLGAIMGFSDLLKSTDLTREEILQHISVIDRNSHHLLRIIDDILDLAKVEAGKMLIEHIDFSLLDLLADFASLMGFRARDKGIEFEMSVSSSIPNFINSDPTRLRQILSNVVGNAIKFTNHGRVQLDVHYEKELLSFRVIDTGTGLSKEQSLELFKPFHQADISTTRKFGGTGLGLVLTKRLAETMGGDFILESSEFGKGSTFIASVKVGRAVQTKLVDSTSLDFIEKPHPEMSGGDLLLSGMEILVVDDSPDNQMLFDFTLKKLGANIDIANDGLEGVNMALLKDYDVVLMDVQMPRMDGHEAARELRSRGFAKPVIALTAHAMVEERARALTSGFTDFLSKPMHREDLINMILKYKNEKS